MIHNFFYDKQLSFQRDYHRKVARWAKDKKMNRPWDALYGPQFPCNGQEAFLNSCRKFFADFKKEHTNIRVTLQAGENEKKFLGEIGVTCFDEEMDRLTYIELQDRYNWLAGGFGQKVGLATIMKEIMREGERLEDYKLHVGVNDSKAELQACLESYRRSWRMT
jgi:hypothetical protein